LASGTPEETHALLEALHPPEEAQDEFETAEPWPGTPPVKSSFDFITGDWLARTLSKSTTGTAVDQWGWDSREMWEPFRADKDLMDSLATHLFRPMAAGYLPPLYREHLTGGREVALSKQPTGKPGVRPICITDARRRICAKGVHPNCSTHFHEFFQRAAPNVLQFGGNIQNGATHMVHLLKALTEAGTQDPLEPSTLANPIATVVFDCRNAFNTLSRRHLARILRRGCTHYVNLPQPAGPPSPFGWDILWGHIRAHYGVHGILKYHAQGTTKHISSQRGVQQGDPLGSTLFALALHPILLDIGNTYPEVVITAYADNVSFTGPLDHIAAAQATLVTELRKAGLELNPADSEVYIPSWQPLPEQQLAIHPRVSLDGPTGAITILLGTDTPFSLRREGVKILGCPIGTPQFCSLHIESACRKILADLDRLKTFPYLHHRTKLALYCCNTRISYLLRAVPTPTIQPFLVTLDRNFDFFLADTLSFEASYETSIHAAAYQRAIQQSRYSIKQGGLGLTSSALVSPAALYVSLREFREWYSSMAAKWQHRSLHLAPWLTPIVTDDLIDSEAYFPYFRTAFDSTLVILHDEWRIHGTESDTRPQHELVRMMRTSSYDRFRALLPKPDRDRLTACAQQTVPTRSADSDIRPARGHDSDHLRHCPLGHFSLTCPNELSNPAFLTSTALLLGIPVPHARVLQTQREYSSIDPWADMLLNDSSHATNSRWASHNAISVLIAEQATNHGITTSAAPRLVPIAKEDTSQKGDLATLVSGVLCKRDHQAPDRSFSDTARLVLDFTLGHTYEGDHTLKTDTLSSMEAKKVTFYKQKYHEQGIAFAPLVTNTFGQFGPELLRFLWALADFAARNRIHLPQPLLPNRGPAAHAAELEDDTLIQRFKRLRSSLFLSARLTVLTAVYEGVTERVYGRTFSLRTNPRSWAALRVRSALWQPGPDFAPLSPPPPLSYADALLRPLLPPPPPPPPLIPLVSVPGPGLACGLSGWWVCE
jgi:hypothetical protein